MSRWFSCNSNKDRLGSPLNFTILYRRDQKVEADGNRPRVVQWSSPVTSGVLLRFILDATSDGRKVSSLMLHKVGRILLSIVLFLSGTGFACPCISCDCVHTGDTRFSTEGGDAHPTKNHDCCGSGNQDPCEKETDSSDFDDGHCGFCDCSNLLARDGELLFVEIPSHPTFRALDTLTPILFGIVPLSTTKDTSIFLSEARVARFEPTLPVYLTHHSLLL